MLDLQTEPRVGVQGEGIIEESEASLGRVVSSRYGELPALKFQAGTFLTPSCLLPTVCSPRGLRLQVFRGLKSKHWPTAPTGGLVPSPFDSGLTLAEETCLRHNCQVTEGVRARAEPLPHLNPGKAGSLGQKRLGSFSDSQAWRDRPGDIQPQLGG